MKKLTALGIIAFALSLYACSNSSSSNDYVRFENALTDAGNPYTFHYGLEYGNAQYLGTLTTGSVTPYIQFNPGTYTLQALDSSGAWLTISTAAFGNSSESGHYTLVMAGDVTTGETFTLEHDY
jgi:hypothetical protein